MKPKSIASLRAKSSLQVLRASAILFASALSASAADFTWDGGGGDNKATTAGNWAADITPTGGARTYEWNASGTAIDWDFSDGDGVATSVEYVIGGDRRVSSQTILATASVIGGNMVFTFSRVDSSETADVALKLQTSTDLADWTTQPTYTIGADTASSTGGVVVAENGVAADTVTVTVPGAAKKFARLNVITTP